MKDFFKTIHRLYNYKIILSFLIVFVVIQIPYIQIIPVSFQLVETPQSYLLRLLAIVIGFSSFILTTLLVIYNIFSKRLRRNSFDFILNNPWVNQIFSIFGGSLIFILLSIFFILSASANTKITLLYFSSFITFGNLFLQFPLIILSLNYSNSYESVKKLINSINDEDIENLYSPNYEDDKPYSFIEGLEKNKLIQLKDIGVSSIKDNDWGMPQTILIDLYLKLVQKIDINTQELTFYTKLSAYSFISKHFQKIALKEADEITVGVALNNILRIHILFAEHKIRHLRTNPIDDNLHDFLRKIIENTTFYNLQQHLLVDILNIIGKHIESISYSDKELPTFDYKLSEESFNYELKNQKITDYWFYITHELPDIFFNVANYSIEIGNKNIYVNLQWHLNCLLSKISKSSNLSTSQENDLFFEYLSKIGSTTRLAIENKIFNSIRYYSYMDISGWISVGKKYGLRVLFEFSYLIHRLNDINALSKILIDDYFVIARSISSLKVAVKEDKLKAIKIIIEDGFKIYNKDLSQPTIKKEIKEQLKWLNRFIDKEEDLSEIKNEFYKKIDNL